MVGEPESLDSDEPLPRRIARHDYDRMLMLSDGVFAIAITLAALEIRTPADWDGTAGALLQALGPGLAAYAVSFAAIAAYWSAHRRMMARVRRVDGAAIALNLVMLGLVSLLPAATRLLTARFDTAGLIPLYLGLIVAIGCAQALFWAYVALARRLVDPSLSLGYRLSRVTVSLFTSPAIAGASILALRSGTGRGLAEGLGIIGTAMAARIVLSRVFPG